MLSSIANEALILVTIIPSPRDLEIARVLGWYRIRFKSAPKVINVDYLAFYQPSSFGESHRWRIETLAAVRGHELVTRKELLRNETDHPRANEEYFKIQIGPLISLSTPVHAEKWKRITFLYTTGRMLKQATYVEDLSIHDEEREILWASLRERYESEYDHRERTQDPEIDMTELYLQLSRFFTSK